MSALFTFALRAAAAVGYQQPVCGADLPAVDAGEIRFLTIAELDLLIEHAPPAMFQELERVV